MTNIQNRLFILLFSFIIFIVPRCKSLYFNANRSMIFECVSILMNLQEVKIKTNCSTGLTSSACVILFKHALNHDQNCHSIQFLALFICLKYSRWTCSILSIKLWKGKNNRNWNVNIIRISSALSKKKPNIPRHFYVSKMYIDQSELNWCPRTIPVAVETVNLLRASFGHRRLRWREIKYINTDTVNLTKHHWVIVEFIPRLFI